MIDNPNCNPDPYYEIIEKYGLDAFRDTILHIWANTFMQTLDEIKTNIITIITSKEDT